MKLNSVRTYEDILQQISWEPINVYQLLLQVEFSGENDFWIQNPVERRMKDMLNINGLGENKYVISHELNRRGFIMKVFFFFVLKRSVKIGQGDETYFYNVLLSQHYS